MGIFRVLELVPKLSCEESTQERLGAFWEDWITGQILRRLKMRATLDICVTSSGRSFSGCRLGSSTELFFLLNHGFDSIVHVLDKIHLGAAESSLVRDVIGVVRGLRVFTVDASDLNVVLVGYGLELVHLCSKIGQLDMD